MPSRSRPREYLLMVILPCRYSSFRSQAIIGRSRRDGEKGKRGNGQIRKTASTRFLFLLSPYPLILFALSPLRPFAFEISDHSLLFQILYFLWRQSQIAIDLDIVLAQTRSRTAQGPRCGRKLRGSGGIGERAGLGMGNLSEESPRFQVLRV